MNFCFFFNDTATTEIYTLSLHDALPILNHMKATNTQVAVPRREADVREVPFLDFTSGYRSEEHTSELQSRQYLVCRLLLEKKILLPNSPELDHALAWKTTQAHSTHATLL